MKKSKDSQHSIYKIALLVSISCVLQISESLIPHPIPGLRLGLANVMTLIALITLGFKPALEVAVLRTILSSFLMGMFMSPGFILSFSGSLISALVMGFLYWIRRVCGSKGFSIVGISIAGALTHNASQLFLAYLILIRHKGIFVFLPWLCIGAVVMGWFTGVIAGRVCRRLKEIEKEKIDVEDIEIGGYALESRYYSPGNSIFHRLGADVKITCLFVLSLVVLVFNNLLLYPWLFLFLIVIALVSGTSFNFLFIRMRKCTSLVFVSFIFPVFFNSGRHALSNVNLGAIFAFRILFLILAGSLLIRTTSPQRLVQGVTKVLSPLRLIGVSQERMAVTLLISWMAVPVFWDMAKNDIREANLGRIKRLRDLVPALTDITTVLYLKTEKVCEVYEKIVKKKGGELK